MNRPKSIASRRKKAELPWMPVYAANALADGSHLSRCDFGAFRRLIYKYWLIQEPLPDDDQWLAAAAGCSMEDWKSGTRERLAKLFEVRKGFWRHLGSEVELAKARRLAGVRSEMARAAANARWGARRAEKERGQMALPLPVKAACAGGVSAVEKELMEQAREVLGPACISKDGGKWRMRCRKKPSLVRKVIEEVKYQVGVARRDGHAIRSMGGYSEDIWQRFSGPRKGAGVSS